MTIRERRMMQRIANLAGVPFTVVERHVRDPEIRTAIANDLRGLQLPTGG